MLDLHIEVKAGGVMDVPLWAVAGILAVAFLAAGLIKLVRSKQQLVDAGMPWANDFSSAR
jgi:hypothetical protein